MNPSQAPAGPAAGPSHPPDTARAPARTPVPVLKSGEEGVRQGLYTPEERERRDRSRWTLVQGILAPLQFLVMLVSAALLLRFLSSGEGAFAAEVSVVIKTGLLYLIMVTGSIWEKEVFGKWLFAGPFFWEDVVSMGVIALHTWYLMGLFGGLMTPTALAWLALVAYAAYAVNAIQFVLKLRAARLQERHMQERQMTGAPGAAA